MMTITSNEGKRSFSLLKRILHYQDVLCRRADLTILHLWLTTEKIIEMFVQANPRKLKLKRVGEYVDGVKFYIQISEENSFISENMIF